MTFAFQKRRLGKPKQRFYWIVQGSSGFEQEIDNEGRARALIKELKPPYRLLKVEVLEERGEA